MTKPHSVRSPEDWADAIRDSVGLHWYPELNDVLTELTDAMRLRQEQVEMLRSATEYGLHFIEAIFEDGDDPQAAKLLRAALANTATHDPCESGRPGVKAARSAVTRQDQVRFLGTA